MKVLRLLNLNQPEDGFKRRLKSFWFWGALARIWMSLFVFKSNFQNLYNSYVHYQARLSWSLPWNRSDKKVIYSCSQKMLGKYNYLGASIVDAYQRMISGYKQAESENLNVCSWVFKRVFKFKIRGWLSTVSIFITHGLL